MSDSGQGELAGKVALITGQMLHVNGGEYLA